MNTLFSMDMSPTEKKQRLSQVYGIEEGIKQNSIVTAGMMIQDNEPASKIMKYTRLSFETLQEIAAQFGKNLVMK